MEKHNTPYTASEIASLWQQYMQETLSLCFLRYFVECAEDQEIRSMIQKILESVKQAVQTMKSLFAQENLPVPIGFTEQDVNVNAPRLYSDPFMLQFLAFMSHAGTQSSCSAIAVTPRADIRQFFIKRVNDLLQLENQIFELLLEKGLFSKSPSIPYPEQVELVQEKSFLRDVFGEQRPLDVMEINHLFINCLRNAHGMELMTGFAQTTQSEEIRAYILKGKELSKRFMVMFNSHMVAEELLPSTLPGVSVTSVTESPFSDKVMLNMIASLNVYALAVYGNSLSQSPRGDLTVFYTRVMTETGSYAAEGAKLLIKYGYLEAPPHLPDRNKLTQ